MKARHAMLVALAAAVTLTAVAAAGPEAAKQRVVITSGASQTNQVAPFVLTPLQAGALKRDSGTLTASASGRTVMRDGQRIEIYVNVGTYKGKLGSLMTRHRTEYVDGGDRYHGRRAEWHCVARSRPLEFPQRRLPDRSVDRAETDGRCARARRSVGRGRTSEMTTNRIQQVIDVGLVLTVGLAAPSG